MDKTTINNNRFAFNTNMYGMTGFHFDIPSELSPGYGSSIHVDFETYNTNEWHDAKHTVEIEVITDSSDACDVTVDYKVYLPVTDCGGIIFGYETSGSEAQRITSEDSSISAGTDAMS